MEAEVRAISKHQIILITFNWWSKYMPALQTIKNVLTSDVTPLILVGNSLLGCNAM
jgi:hypothetical protein